MLARAACERVRVVADALPHGEAVIHLQWLPTGAAHGSAGGHDGDDWEPQQHSQQQGLRHEDDYHSQQQQRQQRLHHPRETDDQTVADREQEEAELPAGQRWAEQRRSRHDSTAWTDGVATDHDNAATLQSAGAGGGDVSQVGPADSEAQAEAPELENHEGQRQQQQLEEVQEAEDGWLVGDQSSGDEADGHHYGVDDDEEEAHGAAWSASKEAAPRDDAW
jgi:hypothetical protein